MYMVSGSFAHVCIQVHALSVYIFVGIVYGKSEQVGLCKNLGRNRYFYALGCMCIQDIPECVFCRKHSVDLLVYFR